MKTYNKYKPSGIEWIGDIPEHWEQMKLGYISTMIVPMRDKPKSLSGSIPWLRIEDFDGKFVAESKSGQGVTEQIIKEMNLKVFPKGTILCSCSCAMGKTAIVEKPLITNQTFIGIVPTEKLFSDFGYYLLSSAESFLNSISTGAIQTYLSRESFEKLFIPLPPINEQTAIADYLDEQTEQIDKLIANKEMLIELLKEERTAIINAAVCGKLTIDNCQLSIKKKPSSIDWLGDIPEHWEVKRLKYFVTVKARLGWKGLKADEYVTEGFGFLSTPNIKYKEIDFENINYITKERYVESPEIMLEIDDVLLAKDGSTLGTINVVKYLPFPSTVNSSIAVLRIKNKNRIFASFLKLFIESDFTQNVIHRIKAGMGVPHLFQADIKEFELLLPPIEEQKEIVKFIESKTNEIDSTISKIEKEIELIKEYRTALISEVVTGKVCVIDNG